MKKTQTYIVLKEAPIQHNYYKNGDEVELLSVNAQVYELRGDIKLKKTNTNAVKAKKNEDK